MTNRSVSGASRTGRERVGEVLRVACGHGNFVVTAGYLLQLTIWRQSALRPADLAIVQYVDVD